MTGNVEAKLIRKPTVGEVPDIQRLINEFADRGEMLPRSLSELYENLRDFDVFVDDGRIVGCCALHICWEDLAEIKSLAVADEFKGSGVGSKFVKRCLEEAAALGIKKVFALTYKPDFFRKHGFQEIDKTELPHKIWNECVKCPKFPNCDETALTIELG